MGPTARLLKAAAWAADRGWSVIPLHAPDSVLTCTCGRKECESPGKHPKLTNWGIKATKDSEMHARWFKRRANIGLVTGNGLMVVDIDVKKDGALNLLQLEKQWEPLPSTLTCLTGGGGFHLYYQVPCYVPNSSGKLGKGIDIRGDGGMVVMPPSEHVSGLLYQWDKAKPSEAVKAPEWLVQLAGKAEVAPSKNKQPDKVIAGERNNYLAKIAGVFRAKGVSPQALEALLQEENKQRCVPPLDTAEVAQIAKSIGKYAPTDDQGAVTGTVTKTGKGKIKVTAGNAAVILATHKDWVDVLSYNELTDRVQFHKSPPPGIFKPAEGDEFVDEHYVYLQQWLSSTLRAEFSITNLRHAVRAVAKQRSYNPLTEWLLSTQWDGEKRLNTWLHDYLGVKDTLPNSWMGRWWMISGVARALQPGVQADHILVLEGGQGRGKSSVCRVLGGEFFLGSMPKMSDSYAGLYLQGYWIVEWGELAGISRVGLSKIKDFVTQPWDVYKRPYDTETTKRPRRCVFIATIDRSEYLEDSENRRFWPVTVGNINLPALERDRDQLWAEAVSEFRKGAAWYPNAAESEELFGIQDARTEHDAWEERIVRLLVGKGVCGFVTLNEVSVQLGLELSKVDQKTQRRISKIMHRYHWKSERRLVDGVRIRGYQPLPGFEILLDKLK